MRKFKRIPKFKNENQEREFWASHEIVDYFDVGQPLKVSLANLRPSTKTITIRLPEFLLNTLKTLAHKKAIPYQSLLKVFLAEKVKEELASP